MSKAKTSLSTLVIFFPSGGQQVVRPHMQFFQGNWAELAECIGRPYYPYNSTIKYEVR